MAEEVPFQTILLSAGVVLAVYLIPLIGLTNFLVFARTRHHAGGRRNPLTKDMLRSPGQTLFEQLDEIRTDIFAHLSVGASTPLLFYAMYVTVYDSFRPFTAALFALSSIAMLGFVTIKVWRLVRRARNTRLGYEGETAVGQELNLLMLDGFHVFHDVAGEGSFNVDHVVVGKTGVFAVETKARAKYETGDGRGHKIVLRDGRLMFPNWTGDAPLQQARRNAKWLGQWLTSAVGESVEARPVVVFPGWYVEREGDCDVGLLGGVSFRGYFKGRSRSVLDDQLVARIRHQLEARCRDVAPLTYRPLPKG